ncbi:MAG: glycosyltransferase, partial [Maribacter dokdonensis]|uniref:glycosyltransferase n=1 Tax=Maribacter dokdonensis TaxID=320912 RepID=UPI003299959D
MKNGKKKILSLIPNLGMGGAQRVFSNVNQVLSEEYEVVSCAFSGVTGQNEFDSSKTYFLDVDSGRTFLHKSINFVKRVRKLRKLKKRLGVTNCISHMEGANFINVLSGTCKTILLIHGSKLHDEEANSHFAFFTNFLIKRLYNKADQIVTVSRGIQEELISHYSIKKSKCIVLNNFFDFTEIEKLSDEKIHEKYEPIFDGEKQVIIHSGRFHDQKNHTALINIFSRLRKLNSSTILILLGDGGLKDKIITLTKSMGLRVYVENDPVMSSFDADVFFLGIKKNPFKYIKRSNVFVFPSKWEGFPMALCEAIICRTLVISSDCHTGPREIIHYDNVDDGKS